MNTENTCSTCRYLHPADKRLSCRRFPPQTHFIIIPVQKSALTPNVMVPSEQQRSAFPLVLPDWTCGEYTPRVELAS